MSSKPLFLSLLLACSTQAVQAHHVWIEQPDNAPAMLHFGEFGDNLREASPGLLDKFGKPTAVLLSPRGERKLEAIKTSSGFVLSGRAGQGEALIAEDAHYPLYSFKQGDRQAKGWYYPAARYVTTLAAHKPALAFDVVPTGRPGEFRVALKGQPLPKVKVSVVIPSGWSKQATSDEQGLVRFDLPWQGTYVVEASHTDKTAGERAGSGTAESYDTVNYVTSLTVVRREGAAALAPVPAAQPNP